MTFTRGNVAYASNDSLINDTKIEQLASNNSMLDILGKVNLSNNIWIVTTGIHAWALHAEYRGGRWEDSVKRSQIFLLDLAMNFLAVFARK